MLQFYQLRTRKTSWSATNALSMNNRLAINRAKFRVSVRVVYILYVYVQHMQARHNFHVSVYYQLYVFHT